MSFAGRIQIVFRDITGFRKKYTPQLIQAAQYEAAKAGVVYLYPKLVRNTPVGSTALLRNSTLFTPPKFNFVNTHGRTTWEVTSTMGATGGASLYAQFVEYGRGAGKFPPVEAMRTWVRRVLRVKGVKEINSVAYLVGRKIAQNGTRAQMYNKKTVMQHQTMAETHMKAAASRVLRNPEMNQVSTVVRKG